MSIDIIARGLASKVAKRIPAITLNDLRSRNFQPVIVPNEAAPTFGAPNTTSQISSSRSWTVCDISTGALKKEFTITGVDQRNLRPLGVTFPSYGGATGSDGLANSTGSINLEHNCYVTDVACEIQFINTGGTFAFAIDDVVQGRIATADATGTAQAGGASTITLAAGASASNGQYADLFVRITGGTGSGQIKRILSYVGSTKVATIEGSWSTNPDNTSTYSIEKSKLGVVMPAADSNRYFLKITFPSRAKRKLTIWGSNILGVTTGYSGSVVAAPPLGQMTAIFVGDSFFDFAEDPLIDISLPQMVARQLGVNPIILGSGGTGFCERNSALNRLNFLDRVAPPAEAWRLSRGTTVTGGTYTISVTYGGSTQTTGALAYNASAATVETALNALSNVVASGATASQTSTIPSPVTPMIIILHGMSGATLSVNSGSITGGGSIVQSAYTGDVALNVPKKSDGTPLPFLLFVIGSGNDASLPYSDAQVQANATAIAQAINANFPTAIPVFFGVVSVQEGGTIRTGDVSRNAAISAAAALLPSINGKVPFIDTYAYGVGGKCWLDGNGNISGITGGSNDRLKSCRNPGHLTGSEGTPDFAGRMATAIQQLFQPV